MDTSVVRATLSSPAHASTMGAASPRNDPEIPAEYQFFTCNVLFTGEPERRQKKYPRSSVKRPMHHSHTAATVLRGLARGTVDVAAHDHGYPIGWCMSSGRGSNDVLGRSDWLSPGYSTNDVPVGAAALGDRRRAKPWPSSSPAQPINQWSTKSREHRTCKDARLAMFCHSAGAGRAHEQPSAACRQDRGVVAVVPTS